MARSAAQSAEAHLPFSMLHEANDKTGGTGDVYVWRAFEDTYKYTWQSKPKEGTTFFCTLVFAEDPSQYCQARFKKTSQN